MQHTNVNIMPKPSANQNPEGLSAVWRSIHKLEGDFEKFTTPQEKVGFWRWVWAERNWFIPAVLIVLASIASGSWYLGALILDRHIQLALKPIQSEIVKIDGEVSEINGTLKVLQGQVTVAKYSAAMPRELKKHHDELASVKTILASAPRNAPNFWSTSFQIITLLSQAQATELLETIGKKPLTAIDNVGAINLAPMIGIYRTKENVLLKNHVVGLNFIDSVIHLDPSVQLANDTFTNCVFIFPTESNPPKNLQQIGAELLTADLSHVIVKGS
jgi:hypothetical protein